MNGNLVVFMVIQERMGSPEAVVIYFVSSRNGKERRVTRKKRLHQGPIQPISVSSRKVPSYIEKRCETE